MTREIQIVSYNNEFINVLTSIIKEKDFNNPNLLNLLSVSEYPNLNNLDIFIKRNKYPILSSFLEAEKERLKEDNKDIDFLKYLEPVNNFINLFSEKYWNRITRQEIENNRISNYIQDTDKLLSQKYKNFENAFNAISDISITREHEVKFIINTENKINKTKTEINKIYCRLIGIQNKVLNKIIEGYSKLDENEKNKNLLLKNTIEQIEENPLIIQYATESDILVFDINDGIILSFEELYSFNYYKKIFNQKNNLIDYNEYSKIYYDSDNIEKELIKIILPGKKKFSDEQILFKFYSDPFEKEDITKKLLTFEKYYGKVDLNDDDKNYLLNVSYDIKKNVLQNLDTLIEYLNSKKYENDYRNTQPIDDIKPPYNLFIEQQFWSIFKLKNSLTINKIFTIYEFFEEENIGIIINRYINRDFNNELKEEHRKMIIDFIKKENKTSLKKELLLSLLIKYICRNLPNPKEPDKLKEENLFIVLSEKNSEIQEKIKEDLKILSKDGAQIKDAISIALFLRKQIRNQTNIIVPDNPPITNNNDGNNQNNNEEEEEEQDRLI